MADIYPSREKDTGIIHSKDLLGKLQNNVKELYYLGSNEEIIQFIQQNAQKDDLILTMGAGNINEVAKSLVSE